MFKLLSNKLTLALGGLLILVATLWYIDSLQGAITKKDTEILQLTLKIKDVVKIAEYAAEQLRVSKKDHKVQLEVLEDSLYKYSAHIAEVEKIKGRIIYVKDEDDGNISTILMDTLRMLHKASSSNSSRDITRTYSTTTSN